MKATWMVVSLGVVLAFEVTQQQSSVCSLLTAAEIGAVAGSKAGEGQPGGSPNAQNGQMTMCMWSVPAQTGGMTLSTGALPPGTSATTIAKQSTGMLRGAKYTIVEKDYDTIWCSVATPPASDKSAPILTTCAGGAKGRVFSLSFMSGTKKLALDETKALLEKAIGRQR
jgi:hypothetical protein